MIDTTKQGFEHAGIHLSDEQYDMLKALNVMMLCPDRQSIPVFNIIMVLKVLGVLPPEMADPLPDEEDFDDYTDYIQALFGRKRE